MDKLAELHHLVLVRFLVYPVDKREFHCGYMGRHSLIGSKHELLYDLMCQVPLRHDDVLGLTLYV